MLASVGPKSKAKAAPKTVATCAKPKPAMTAPVSAASSLGDVIRGQSFHILAGLPPPFRASASSSGSKSKSDDQEEEEEESEGKPPTEVKKEKSTRRDDPDADGASKPGKGMKRPAKKEGRIWVVDHDARPKDRGPFARRGQEDSEAKA